MVNDDYLSEARKAAEAAAVLLKSYFGAQYEQRSKSDGTPVTEADEGAEKAIKAILTDAFPEHGFYGEEGGAGGMDRDRIWLVDPLDGTKSFIADTPFFSTQIALMEQGELTVGVSSAPIFGETAWAQSGGGAYMNGKPIRVSTVDSLTEARISTGNIQRLAASAQWKSLGRLLAGANRTRGYGDFCHYHLLARGVIDVVVESDLNILDIAALTVVVREAGGVITDLEGKAIGLETRSVLATNAHLHGPVMEVLHG